MNQTAQTSTRNERRITLLFIAAGSIFAFIGTILGALMLARMSGVTIPFNLALFQDHPYLQIFGFLSEFVLGVGYSIVPLFKSKKLANPRTAYMAFSLITTANIISIFAVVGSASYYVSLFQVLSFLILLSSAIFCYQILRLLGRPSKTLGEAEPFLSMAAVSFVLISIVFFLDFAKPELLVNAADLFSAGFIYLSLAGFAGSMIFGVELRTVAFRMTNYRKATAKITAVLQAIAIGLSFLSIFRGLSYVGSVASVTFFLSAISFAVSIRLFEGRKKSRVLLPLTEGRPNVASHNTISDYTDSCIISSVLWLLFSFLLGMIWQVFGIGNFSITDSFIHSIAIGFIGSAIIAYAVVLLPGVISQKAPKKHLSLLPLLFLNAGLLIRNIGNFYSSLSAGSLPVWESLSGVLIVVAMVLLVNNVHYGRTKTT
ncbi:MAG: cbb3-type cytochrome c oxidase subunit I [Thaumarchaeota archaeon]|nr:cbb3-type cytochrome c oxidase subunit I [Nitrososphaerota archaeon]